ncbi:hypothetical protein [Sporomusa sp. KB1]|jgi:hypothetical protein|uniref:hypothetical protein n=1 Tax=Sporomusa sp. KB1 TaxID=943346 RepID=UPI0011A96912|nr:hypothetical protein [Sporomusa sp. KB1]TWH48391.1 hypothetical protein Salpa_4543 [Sporomusa sp. KB1]
MKISDFILVANNIPVDTLPLFVQLAADTSSAYKEIDLLYEIDKTRYQTAASHSSYANHPLFTISGIDRQIYALKYLGMVLVAMEDGPCSPLFEQVIRILTKRWSNLYGYIKNAETIDLSKAAQPEYYAESDKDVQYHNLLTGAAIQYLQYFIAMYPAIDLPPHASLKFAMFITCVLGKKAIIPEPETLFVVQTLASKLDNTSDFQQLKNRLNKPAIKKMARQLKNAIYQKVFYNYLEPWNGDHFWEGMAHCTAYLSSSTGLSLASPKILTKIKERDVELLCRLYIIKMTSELFRSNHTQSHEDLESKCAEFVMFGLSLLEFIREYKKTRKYYFEQNNPFLSAEMDNLKKQLRAYEIEVRRMSADLAAKTDLLAQKEEELNALVLKQKFVVNALSKETELLQTKLTQAENHRRQSKDIENSNNIINLATSNQHYNIEAALSTLSNIHALVIGGAENWQTKLKTQLPNFVYLSGDANGFDEALIIHADIIFANVRCKFSHDCFYKMIKLIRYYDKRLVFLSKTNIPLTIQQMASAAIPTYSVEESVVAHSNIRRVVEV